ncbi:MAG: transposase [Thermoplasmatales archaeon]|nr:transposase [Thermoplasmatales archaeon]MCW6170396.1 transposase [Thermoplasmatales archaeon]
MGFFDESAPQTTANTARSWSFSKPEIVKDTSKHRTNIFGFYSFNGNSVVDFQDHSREENIIFFLKMTRELKPEKSIMIILYDFRPHHSKAVKESIGSLNMKLIFLPPYSPDLNPIEFICKSIKRVVSIASMESESDLKDTIKKSFMELLERLIYAKRSVMKFPTESITVR